MPAARSNACSCSGVGLRRILCAFFIVLERLPERLAVVTQPLTPRGVAVGDRQQILDHLPVRRKRLVVHHEQFAAAAFGQVCQQVETEAHEPILVSDDDPLQCGYVQSA